MQEISENLVYPYTCPFFRSDNAVTQGYGFSDFSDCIHWREDDCERLPWETEERPITYITGCTLHREVCAIALDLNVEGVPTSAEDVLKGFSNVPEGELATIRANVDQFFRTLEVKKDDRY